MGWHGINLTSCKQQKWAKRSVKNILTYGISVIFSLAIAIIVYLIGQHLLNENQKVKTNQENDLTQLSQLEQKIHQLKIEHKPSVLSLMTKRQVQQFIAYLNQIAIQGGLEIIQLYLDQDAKIKLIGKTFSQSHFDQVEQQLKQQKYHFQIEHFQTNDKNQIEFNIIIILGHHNDNAK